MHPEAESELDAQAKFADALLRYFRGRLGVDSIGFSVPPTRLTGGYDTTIWAFELGGAPETMWSQPLVARVFHPGQSIRPRHEAAIHSAIAEQGFPCPPPLLIEDADEPLGGPFFIMPRLAGHPLLDSILSPAGLIRVPRLLARTQLALHALDTAKVRDRLAAAGFDQPPGGTAAWLRGARGEIEQGSYAAFEPALRWLEANQPAPSAAVVVCHCDFHPLNLLTERGRVTGVIDWSNILFAEPEVDVAFSRTIMTMGPIDGGRFAPILGRARVALTALYEREYRKDRPLDQSRLRYFEALRCFLAMLNATRAKTKGQPFLDAYAWGRPQQSGLMTAHFQRISGVALPRP